MWWYNNPKTTHNHEKYDNNGKAWYFPYEDENNIPRKYFHTPLDLSPYVLSASEQFYIMLIMTEGSIHKTEYDLNIIMHPAYMANIIHCAVSMGIKTNACWRWRKYNVQNHWLTGLRFYLDVFNK